MNEVRDSASDNLNYSTTTSDTHDSEETECMEKLDPYEDVSDANVHPVADSTDPTKADVTCPVGTYKDSYSKQAALGSYKDSSSEFVNSNNQNFYTRRSNNFNDQVEFNKQMNDIAEMWKTPDPILIIRPVVTYDWQRLSTRNMPSRDSILESFERRIPRYLFVEIGEIEYKIRPTEYLISYSNGFTAVGMLKSQKDIEQNPLTIQFGHWSLQNAVKLCVGSTVLVRSYMDIVKPKRNRFVPNSNKKFRENDYLRDGFVFASAIAASWTVTNKPELTRSLGTVKSFCILHRNEDLYKGEVYDCECKTKAEVADNLWEYKMKKEPELDDTVVLTWAEISEQHITYKNRGGVIQLLPLYALKELGVGKNNPEKYWLVSVDTCYPQI